MRKISIIVDSRANYTRAATIIEAIDNHPDLTCRFIACSHFAHDWQAFTYDRPPDSVLVTMEDELYDTPIAMAKSSARLIDSLAECFRGNPPDVVIAMTDRYETLAVATTAALMNIRVAHVQGGELTGTIDESIRHAVTKLSHIHFPATNKALYNIISMGEDSEYVFNVGCPATDLLLRQDISERLVEEPYVLVLYHPVTTEYKQSYIQMQQVLKGVKAAWDGMVIVIGPNHDAGNRGVWQAIKDADVKAPHTVPYHEFIQLMAHADVMVGNSSAGIREACYFGTPVVDVGTRQQGRMPRGNNVWFASTQESIRRSIIGLSTYGRYDSEYLYGDGTAGTQIAEILATIKMPNIQKRFYRRNVS